MMGYKGRWRVIGWMRGCGCWNAGQVGSGKGTSCWRVSQVRATYDDWMSGWRQCVG
jgi:hypothetical protein